MILISKSKSQIIKESICKKWKWNGEQQTCSPCDITGKVKGLTWKKWKWNKRWKKWKWRKVWDLTSLTLDTSSQRSPRWLRRFKIKLSHFWYSNYFSPCKVLVSFFLAEKTFWWSYSTPLRIVISLKVFGSLDRDLDVFQVNVMKQNNHILTKFFA